MTLLLNSFSLVPLLVGICAEMDDTSFEFVHSCSAASRDLRRDGLPFFLNSFSLVLPLVGNCAEMDGISFELICFSASSRADH